MRTYSNEAVQDLLYDVENQIGFHGRYTHQIYQVFMVLQLFCISAPNGGIVGHNFQVRERVKLYCI